MDFLRQGEGVRLRLQPASAQECLRIQDRTFGERTVRVGPFESKYRLTDRQMNILGALQSYYDPARVSELLAPLLQQSAALSLRALDWLVTNYSKRHNVVCTTRHGEPFNIHQGYKITLHVNKRRDFDPFRRRLRISVFQSDRECVESTVGQVNFLHWANENGVIEYLRVNRERIEAEMNATTRESRLRRKQGSSEKRRELTKAPASRCMVYHVNSAMVFNPR